MTDPVNKQKLRTISLDTARLRYRRSEPQTIPSFLPHYTPPPDEPLLQIFTEDELSKNFTEAASDDTSQFKKYVCSHKPSCQNPCSTCDRKTLVDTIHKTLPITAWMPAYTWRKSFITDLIIGVTLGFVIAPKALAHALLANVSSIAGLYTVFFSTLIYGLLGNGKWLSVGTAALPAMLFGESIGVNNEGAAPMLTLWIGVFTLLIGLLRLDRLLVFVPPPVFSAVTTTAAFLIGTSQVKYIFGLHIYSTEFLQIWIDVFKHIDETNWVAFGIGSLGIIFLRLNKRINQKYLRRYSIPDFGAAILVLVTIIASWQLNLHEDHGVDVVGYVEPGLPVPIVPWQNVSSDMTLELIQDGAILAIVNFLLSMAIAKTFAKKSKSDLFVGQEIRALASVNVVGSFFGTIVAGGSFSGSAILSSLQATSLLHNFINAFVVMLLLVVMTPLIAPLPKATLAAIIIAAVPSLIDFSTPKRLWRTKISDFFIWTVTFVVTLFAGVRIGLITGIVISLLMVVYHSTRAPVSELGQLKGTSIYRALERFPSAQALPGIRLFRLDTSINFANSEAIESKLHSLLENKSTAPKLENQRNAVVVGCEAVNEIDTAGILMLQRFAQHCELNGYELYFSGWKASIRETLYRAKANQPKGEAQPPRASSDSISSASTSNTTGGTEQAGSSQSTSKASGAATVQDVPSVVAEVELEETPGTTTPDEPNNDDDKDNSNNKGSTDVEQGNGSSSFTNSPLDSYCWYLNMHDAVLHIQRENTKLQTETISPPSKTWGLLNEESCVEVSRSGHRHNWNYAKPSVPDFVVEHERRAQLPSPSSTTTTRLQVA